MTLSSTLEQIPDIILIVGTDASGKDHVANILEKIIREAGGEVERRKRYLCGEITRERSSVKKTEIELFLERCFLGLFPFLGFLLPFLLKILLQHDLSKFSRPDKKLVVVGHNCLRGMAFYWGHRFISPEQIRISGSLQKTLIQMQSIRGFHTLVLDIDDQIRKRRIERREALGEADNFDRYMADKSEQSERIESCLVWLSRKYLNGSLIENNDLTEEQLRTIILASFP